MTDLNAFAPISGTLIGDPHYKRMARNQDAKQLMVDPEGRFIIGVSCDGVSECPRSEIGSEWLAWVVMWLIKYMLLKRGPFGADWLTKLTDSSNPADAQRFLVDLRTGLVHQYSRIIDGLHVEGVSKDEVISLFLISTMQILIITPKFTLAARSGDGVLVLNDSLKIFDSGASNSPDAVVYALIENRSNLKSEPNTKLELMHFGATDAINFALIGTDGVVKFNEHQNDDLCLVGVEGNKIPTGEKHGDIMQFSEPVYQKRPHNAQLKLNRIAQQGRLPGDDTTFVGVSRRHPCE